jgi:hypothetical protein
MPKGSPILVGKKPLTRSRAKRRAIVCTTFSLATLGVTAWALVTMGATGQVGTVYDATVQEVRLEVGAEYEHVVLVNEGPYAGQS